MSPRYKVFTTEQFEGLWRRAINAGVVDEPVGASQLNGLIAFLSVDPYYYPLLEAAGRGDQLALAGFYARNDDTG